MMPVKSRGTEPVPCHHKRAAHEHGTAACYKLDKCGCVPCCEAVTAERKDRERAHRYGRYDKYADAAPVRAHIDWLMGQGMGSRMIGEASGLGRTVVQQVRLGKPVRKGERNRPPARVLRQTAEAILAVREPQVAGRVLVPAVGSTRRLRALVAVGWSQQQLAEALGQTTNNLGLLLHERQDLLTKTKADKVVEVYDALWDKRPPTTNRWAHGAHNRSRRYAAAKGWALPMQWDDDTIDDPTAEPDLSVEKHPGGKKVHVDDVEFLVCESGMTKKQVAHRMRVSPNTLEIVCTRNERKDLLARMERNELAEQVAS